MERKLKSKTGWIQRNTVMFMAGNVVCSVLYFGLIFLKFGKDQIGILLILLAGYGIIEAAACAGYLYFFKSPIDQMINTVKKASQDEYEAQNLRSQAEIFALQSQINPHFLYNTLDTIRSYALSSDAEDIADMTEALSTLFRYSISRPGELATLREELDNVKHYLLIQQYRFPDKVEYIEEIEDEDVLDYRMPILTIQPIIENAIHHGLEMRVGKGLIKLRAFRTDHRITVMISDNGVGMNEENLEILRGRLDGEDEKMPYHRGERRRKGTGIALINVNKRLKFYYGSQFGLTVRSTQNVGTMVEINLPAELDKVEISGGQWNEKRSAES